MKCQRKSIVKHVTDDIRGWFGILTKKNRKRILLKTTMFENRFIQFKQVKWNRKIDIDPPLMYVYDTGVTKMF